MPSRPARHRPGCPFRGVQSARQFSQRLSDPRRRQARHRRRRFSGPRTPVSYRLRTGIFNKTCQSRPGARAYLAGLVGAVIATAAPRRGLHGDRMRRQIDLEEIKGRRRHLIADHGLSAHRGGPARCGPRGLAGNRRSEPAHAKHAGRAARSARIPLQSSRAPNGIAAVKCLS